VSKKRTFAKAVFWCLLAFGTLGGSPIDPQDIEDTLRIMNETKIEVVLEKGDSPPDFAGAHYRSSTVGLAQKLAP